MNLKYAIRKTSLGVGSVAIAAVLAAQTPTASAQDVTLDDGTALTADTPAPVLTDAENPFSNGTPSETEVPVKPEETANTESDVVDTPDTTKANTNAEETDTVDEPKVSVFAAETDPATDTEETSNTEDTSDTEATEETPNYQDDEALIKDYDETTRYRDTRVGPDTNELISDGHTASLEGVNVEIVEPGKLPTSSSTSFSSRKDFGFVIAIDKSKQRTYNDILILGSSTQVGEFATKGTLNMLPIGEVPISNSEWFGSDKKVTHQGNPATIAKVGREPFTFTWAADEGTLEHINNKNQEVPVLGLKAQYKKDNTEPSTQMFNNADSYVSVNPWPNENDAFRKLSLDGEYKDRIFLNGQVVDTGIRVRSVDESAAKRLVGQIYNPLTNKVVKGSKAWIEYQKDANGKYVLDDSGHIQSTIKVQLPQGPINADGSYNKDSIFLSEDFKALQNLSVRFFARPRTQKEFEDAIPKDNSTGEKVPGIVTETGAGTRHINHDGKDVEIALQGIDRYDHYNLIGDFNLNLDDTRYYDQNFKDGHGDDTADKVYTKVRPGEAMTLDLYVPNAPKDHQKSPEEMTTGVEDRHVHAALDMTFIENYNEGKDPKDQWKVEFDEKNPTHVKVTPPKSLKGNSLMALPLTYTYTNGSTDTHWFHFYAEQGVKHNLPTYGEDVVKVVHDSDNTASVFNPTEAPGLKPNLSSEDGLAPSGYALASDTFKDNQGNTWKVSIDDDGTIHAVPDTTAGSWDGSEILTVPVTVEYTHDNGDTFKETTEAIFTVSPAFVKEHTVEHTEVIPFETKIIYDPELDWGKEVVDQEGVLGEKLIKQGLKVNANDPEGTSGTITVSDNPEATSEEIVREKQDKIIRIGVKPQTTTVDIPYTTEYELDFSLDKDSDPIVTQEGVNGVVTVTHTFDPDTHTASTRQETTTVMVPKKVKIPAGSSGKHTINDDIPFDTEVRFNPDLAPGETKVVQEGQAGSRTQTVTIKNSEVTDTSDWTVETEPQNRIIEVGSKTHTGVVEHDVTEDIPYDVKVQTSDDLPLGHYEVVTPGQAGLRTTHYRQSITNGQLDGDLESVVTDRKDPVTEVIVVGTKPAENETPFKTDVPVDITVNEDETLPKGVVEFGDLTPGHVETVTETVYNPETGELETVTRDQVTPGKQTVTVGTGNFETNTTHTVTRDLPYEREIIYDDTLPAGTQVIDQAGELGKETVSITVSTENGRVHPVETGSVINKEAVKEIVRIGTQPIEVTHPLEHKTEYVYHKDLKPGETKVKTPGKDGTITTEFVYNSETHQLVEGDTRRDEPTTEVVEFGGDTEGSVTFKQTIPMVVEIVEDNTLLSGEQVVVQEGHNGEETVTVTINNSEETERSSEITTPMEKRIIKIGTLCPAPEVPETSETGTQTEETETTETGTQTEEEDKPETSESGTQTDEPLTPLTPAEEIEEEGTPLIPLVPAEEIEEDTPLIPLTPADEIEEDTPLIPLVPAEEIEEDTPLIPLTPAEEIEEDTPLTPLTPAEEIEKDTPLTPLEPSEEIEKDTPLTPLEPSEEVDTPAESVGETPSKPSKPAEPSQPTEDTPAESVGETPAPTEGTQPSKPAESVGETPAPTESNLPLTPTSAGGDTTVRTPKATTPAESSEDTLPDTGESNPALWSAGALSLLTALGLLAPKRKDDDA